VPKLFTLCECSDVTGSQVTPYKQSTAPLLLQSCCMGVLHLAALSQLVIVNELTHFSVISRNPHHLLHHLLPPPSAASQNYELGQRIHNRSLPDCAGHLSDVLHFILRMIYKDKY